MTSKVYFADMRTNSKRNLLDKAAILFDLAGFGEIIEKNDLVALKLHVGEPGNLAFVAPPFVRRIVEKVKEKGGKPFLTDSNTLYVGRRANAVDHMISAYENGFSYATVGAPFVVADGLNGHEYVKVPVKGQKLKETRIGAAIAHADALIAITHFKGHEATGFGGVFKNIGMGSASRTGKQEQHSDVRPRVNPKICTRCGRCLKWCPAGAITQGPDKIAFIDSSRCIGCAECTITCTNGAIAINWIEGQKGTLQEKMVEYAMGVLNTKPGKAGFISFVMNVSPECDCCNWNDAPIVPNIGILASQDPVALDQACIDLVNAAPALPSSRLEKDLHTEDKFGAIHKGVDWHTQLSYAEELGLGRREYELIKIDR